MTAPGDGNAARCKYCGSAATALCALHLLAIVVFSYRRLGADLRAVDFAPPNDGLTMFVVNYGTFLAPIVLILLSRKVPVLLALCAIPVLFNLAAQVYYEWLFLTTGTNPSIRQKGDWVSWLPMVLGVIGVAALAMWLFAVALWVVGTVLERVIGQRTS